MMEFVAGLVIVVVFGIEHREWLAGMAAGAVYGWLYLRSRNIWVPVVAHVTTNLALGIYVVGTGAWYFW